MLSYKNEELDLLIFFYLQECGYFHSAFAFSHETNINFIQQLNYKIPPGLLISLIQRGILYTEMEIGFPALCVTNFRSPVLDFVIQNKKELFKENNNFLNKKYMRNIFFFSHYNAIQACLWHPRRSLIYLGTFDSKIYLWNLTKKKDQNDNFKILLKIEFTDISNRNSGKNEINNIDCNLNGTLYSCSDFKGIICFWTETGILLKKIFLDSTLISDLKWSENSRYIALTCVNGKIIIFSTWFMKKLFEISILKLYFSSMKWMSNSWILFSPSYNKISVLKTNKTQVFEIFAHSSKICDVILNNLQNCVASCSKNGKIRIWMYKIYLKLAFEINAHIKEITQIKWKPLHLNLNSTQNTFDRNMILSSVSLDCSVKFWDIQKRKCIFKFYLKKPILSSAWNLYQNKIVLGLSGGIVILINFEKKKYSEIKSGKYAIFDIISNSFSVIFLFISSIQIGYM